jgi:ankyrin repeat protein
MGGIHSKYVSLLKSKSYTKQHVITFIKRIITQETINKTDKYGNTFLMLTTKWASGQKLNVAIHYLLKNGANPNIEITTFSDKLDNAYYASSPLLMLCRKYQEGALISIQNLINYNAELPPSLVNIFLILNKKTKFINTFNLHISLIKYLLEKGISIETSIELKCSSLIIISLYKNFDVYEKVFLLKKLIEMGADQHYRDEKNNTYLDYLQYDIRQQFLQYFNKGTTNIHGDIYINRYCITCYNGKDNENIKMCLFDCNHAILCVNCITQLANKNCPYCKFNIIGYKVINVIS